ncbi:MAG: hypothetical protein IPK15_20935 [Verrucomicrobia bacterium]|nr:hypothetical protein [Verrucomicrobiota bacterium]
MQLGSKKNRPTGGVATRCLASFGNLTRQVIAWLPALSVAICLGLATEAGAQGLGRPDLLDTANLPAGDDAPPEPGASRARYIRVNSQILASPDSPLRQPAPAELQLDSSRLQLSLFTDTTLTAALEKTLYRNDNNYVASGVIDDWPGSHVIVVVEGEIIAASLTVPGMGVYQIRYDTNGFHKVLEIDPQQLPGCNLVKKAPKKPRPIKLSKKKNIPPIKNGSEPGSFSEPPMMFSAAGVFSRDVFGAQFPEPDASSNTNVDVMVVYTAAAKNGAGGLTAMNTLIDLAIAEANEAYADSLIPVTLNLVYRGEVTYTESGNAATDLTRLQNPSDGHMDAVHATRNQFGADIVCLLTETMQSTYAGLGYLMTTGSTNFSSYAFNVVRRTYAVGNYTFAHELGHNMGCAHDRQNSSTPGVFDYSYGHRFVGSDNQTYRTVMAYSPGTRIGHFSNPNVTYQGTATGVAAGATNSADNAASISNAVPYVSAFRAPVVVFSFTATSNTVAESTNTVTIDVRRSGPTNASVNIDYTMVEGTASDGVDFNALNGTITFSAGQTNKTISLELLDDDVRESVETLTVRLSNPGSGTMLTSNLTVYITDNDTSYVQFASTGFSVAEGTNSVNLEVQRSGVTNTAVTVGYYTVNSTATAGTDYLSTNGLLSFSAGETSKTFAVTVFNDAAAEASEALFVRLRYPTNTVLGTPTNFTLTILTNDRSVIAFSAATTSTSESNSTVDVTVSRTGTTFNNASIDFHTTNVTATAGSDYTATNGTVTFTNGQTTATITLVVANDATLESSETFRVRLYNPIDATLGTIGTNTVTITDDDASFVSFDASTNLVYETNDTVTFTVLRTGVTNTAVSVNYTTTNVTATAGTDYFAASGILTFAAGVVSNGFTVSLTNDLTQESLETFQVRLLSPTNTAVSLGTNLVTITDNDAATVAFLHGSTNVAEGVGTVTITALRSGATNTAVSVRFYSTNGTAGATDYFTTNGILSFAANEVSKSFDLRIIDDALAENAETVILRLVSPTNATISGFGTNLVTIGTNDSAYVSWSVASVSTNESTNAITLTVNRTGTTFNDVSVNFATTNVTALAAADYYATNGTLTLTNGQTTATIALRLLNDDLQESTETLQVRLSGVSDGIITNGTNTITITDDDVSTLAFATNAITTGESNVTLTVVVERSGATNTAVAVNYTTTNVTATAASDYTATSGTLSFVPGVVSNSFTVDVLHDLALRPTRPSSCASPAPPTAPWPWAPTPSPSPTMTRPRSPSCTAPPTWPRASAPSPSPRCAAAPPTPP